MDGTAAGLPVWPIAKLGLVGVKLSLSHTLPGSEGGYTTVRVDGLADGILSTVTGLRDPPWTAVKLKAVNYY